MFPTAALPPSGGKGVLPRLPLGFAEGLLASGTALTRFVWRGFDADSGRFTALDPLGAKGGDTDWYGCRPGGRMLRSGEWGGRIGGCFRHKKSAPQQGRSAPRLWRKPCSSAIGAFVHKP